MRSSRSSYVFFSKKIDSKPLQKQNYGWSINVFFLVIYIYALAKMTYVLEFCYKAQ